MNPLDFLLGKTKPSSRGSVPGFPPAPRGRFPSSWGTPKVPVSAIPKGGTGLLGPVGTLVDLAYTVPKVFNPNDNIITSLQNLGTSIQNQFSTQTRGYVGSSPTAVAADQRRYRGVIGSIPPSADGESYRRAELRLADAARSGGGGGGGGNAGYSLDTFTRQPGMGSPADRAYQQEKARVAQMTEQDPMFKKYQVAELSKQYNAAKGDEREKIGMQIWAQTNPELAAKLRPGATGYSDVATAFQKLSPVGNFAGSMAPSNFTMPAVDSNTMPTVEQAFGVSAPQFNIPGMDTSSMTTAVAPGAFSQPLSTDITKYLTDPVKAYAPTEKVDQTKLALLRQAYNQRFK